MPKTKKSYSAEEIAIAVRRASKLVVDSSADKAVISEQNVKRLYKGSRDVFRYLMRQAQYDDRVITALLTKYNDAGPRSAPWKPVSSRVPGRPQDGKDGNRIQRWQLPENHKFYSTLVDGTLVAVKYIFQTLSMTGAPETPHSVSAAMRWLLGHPIQPGAFRDPVQLIEVRLQDVLEDPRLITSGHIQPLDRGGRHLPENTSLLLKSSNDLQGNNTIDELLEMIKGILVRHGKLKN